ncbi:MAG: nitroreductase family protein [Pseudomonadota bacterium]
MIEQMRSRRSIRRFQDWPVSAEHVALLQEALLRAPSARNARPTRFVMVQGHARVAPLAACKPTGAGFLDEAPLALVICGDPGISDMWIEDCAIAATFAQLEAHALGLGSCWCQVRGRPHDEEKDAETWVLEHLRLPEGLRVLCILGVGHPAEQREGWPDSALAPERVTRVG